MAAAPFDFIDITWAKVPIPKPDGTPTVTLPLGGLWQPNDYRVVCFCGDLPYTFSDYATSYSSGTYTYATLPAPAGWTALVRASIAGMNSTSQTGIIALGRRLVAGDQDTEASIVIPAGIMAGFSNYTWWGAGYFSDPAIFAFTVRGVDPTSTPIGSVPVVSVNQGPAWQFPTTWTFPSRSLGTTPGCEVFCIGTLVGSLATPSGWTDLWDNGTSLDNAVRPSNVCATMGIAGKKYASGSSSGSTVFNLPDGRAASTAPIPPDASPFPQPFVLYFKQAVDVVVSTATATAETDLANAATATLGTSVVVPTGTATGETDLAGMASNGLTGFFVRDPYILGAGPVLDSSIRWVETSVPGRSSVLIETSLDRGATWQVATNGGPIPGLRKGNTSVDAVYIRGTITRLTLADAMPKAGAFEPHVSMDDGRDELVPIFTGQLKQSDIEDGMDVTGGGSGGSSSGLVTIGGGITGGGRTISMQGSDLSRAIDLAGWNAPKYIAPGTLYTDALIDMVTDRLPTQRKFDLATSTQVTPLLLYGVTPGAKPFKDIDELAMAIGWWAYFRPDGTFRACPVPDPALARPVWEYRDNVSISNIKKSLTDQDFYNHIIVNGLATSPQSGQPVVPIRAESVDLDPVTGIYGKAGRTYEVTLPAITNQAQGQTASDALLLRMKGCPELVTITIPVNPLLEPGDVIAITARTVKASGNYVINGFDVPGGATRGQKVTGFRQSIAS